MTIKEICKKYNFSQAALARRFGIPARTMEDWCAGRRNPPPYVVAMMQEILEMEDQKKEAMNMKQ